MIGRDTPHALGSDGRELRLGNDGVPFKERLSRLSGNSYSRRVALLKLALPAIGGALLLMVLVWPRLAPLFDRFRWAAIDLRDARELRMINPRYAGTDRDGRPFVITAAVGRQVPQRNDVMALDDPVANVQSHSGAKIRVSANSGVYQTQTQFLDMFGQVTIKREDGSIFTTAAARVDAANDAAEGTAPVEGHGPQGNIVAQGFQVLDKGDIVIFTGHADLVLTPTKQQTPGAEPAAVPAPVAEAAAQLEAKAEERHVAPRPRAEAAPARPVHQRHAAHTAREPAQHHPSAKKPH